MQRRSFLQLLLATPWVPALAKLEHIAPTVALPVVGPARDWRAVRYALSIGSASLVHAGRIERYVCKPPHLFRPDRLMVGSLSQDFDLLHVAANGEPQIEDSVPASIFSPLAYGSRLRFANVAANEEIVIAVRNRGQLPAPFIASFVGTCLCEP